MVWPPLGGRCQIQLMPDAIRLSAISHGVDVTTTKYSARGRLRSATNTPREQTQEYYIPRDISARFGMRLRELRKERCLTQLRMATDFGIDRSFISDVERGQKSISLPMLEIIAIGLDLSMSELLKNL